MVLFWILVYFWYVVDVKYVISKCYVPNFHRIEICGGFARLFRCMACLYERITFDLTVISSAGIRVISKVWYLMEYCKCCPSSVRQLKGLLLRWFSVYQFQTWASCWNMPKFLHCWPSLSVCSKSSVSNCMINHCLMFCPILKINFCFAIVMALIQTCQFILLDHLADWLFFSICPALIFHFLQTNHSCLVAYFILIFLIRFTCPKWHT